MMAVDDMMRPVYSYNSMVDIKEEMPPDSGSKATIHSGHFMVSRVHDINNDDDEEEVTTPYDDDSKGYDFYTANREPRTTYNFSNGSSQAVGIDASLTKLFECMTLAYSGKITSPKWKQFRGLHLSQKQRIRLNNLIWREWHLQYIYGKSPMVCQFATPLSDHIHSKPEAVVLEGKYWKRQLDAVTAEYKKWRRYFRERIRHKQNINFQNSQVLSEWELLERVKEVTFIPHSEGSYISNTDLNLPDEMTDMDFTNELFASLNQPFAFPNPRELSQLSCADLIQPGLIQLQPNLEEFMDIDTMQELFNGRVPSSLASAFMTDSSPAVDMSLGGLQNSDMSLENFLRGAVSNSNIMHADTFNTPVSTVLSGNSTSFFDSESSGASQNVAFQLTSDGQYHLDPTTILLGATLSQGSPQTFTFVPTGLYNQVPNLTNMLTNAPQKHVTSSAMSSSELLTQLLEQHQQPLEMILAPRKLSSQQSPVPIQPAPSLNQHQRQQQLFQTTTSSRNPLLSQSLSVQHQARVQSNHTQQKLLSAMKVDTSVGVNDNIFNRFSSGFQKEIVPESNKKKDGPFTLPMAKPVSIPRKPRMIAPAQPVPIQQNTVISSTSTQASYLAELLKNGTYPGALINVKKEPQLSTAVSSPIKTTTNFYQHLSPSYNPAFGQNIPGSTMVSMNTGNPVHKNLPMLSSAEASDDASDLGIVTLSSSLTNYDHSVHMIKDSPVRYFQANESKLHSSVSHMSNSPGASPPLINRTPSPNPNMDIGSFVDPVSPFSPSMPLSPSSLVLEGSADSPGSGDSSFPKEHRRSAHLSAEQKRRCSLKTGFDMLQQLVPSLSQNPKVSKASMLQKTAEYCKKLKAERVQMQKESAILKQEIDALNSAISIVQSQLPETGVPVTRQRKDQMKEMFDEYVRIRTNENSKFWIFSMLMSTLYDSYCNTVSTSSIEELCRTALTWLDQSCSLVALRPNVLNALRKLSTSTPILTEPQRMKEHALHAVAKKGRGQRSNNMMAK